MEEEDEKKVLPLVRVNCLVFKSVGKTMTMTTTRGLSILLVKKRGAEIIHQNPILKEMPSELRIELFR